MGCHRRDGRAPGWGMVENEAKKGWACIGLSVPNIGNPSRKCKGLINYNIS